MTFIPQISYFGKMKTLVTLLFLLLSLPLLSQSISYEEAIQLASQLKKDGIISSKGKAELIRGISNEPMKLAKTVRKAREGGTGMSYHYYSEAPLDAPPKTLPSEVNLSSFLAFFSSLEVIQAGTEEANLYGNPSLLAKKIEVLKGPVWKQHQPSDEELQSQGVSFLQEQFSWWLQTLDGYGLLEDSTKRDALAWIDQAPTGIPSMHYKGILGSFFEFVGSRAFYYEKKSVYQADQLAYVDTLKANGLLSSDSYRALVASYGEEDVKSSLDILQYFDRSMVVDLKQMPGDLRAKDQYAHFLQMLKDSLLPDMEIGAIESFVRTYPDYEYGGTYEVEILSIELNDHLYEQAAGTLYPNPDLMMTDVIFSNFREGDVFFLQQYLTDQGTPYRLYVMEDKNRLKQTFGSRLGVMLLDSSEQNVLLRLPWVFMELHPGIMYHEIPSRDQLFQQFQAWKSIGLGDWSEAEIDSIIPTVRSDSRTRSVLEQLGLAIDFLNEDNIYETDEPLPPFYPTQAYLAAMSRISRGAFMPTDIQQGWELYPESDSVFPASTGFVLGRQTYTKEVMSFQEGDRFWHRGGVVEMVNDALEDQKIDGRYYCIGHSSEFCSRYVFLTAAQYAHFKKHHVEMFPESN